MTDWLWSKYDDRGIARFVLNNATDWLTSPRPPVNWNDMHQSVEDREKLVKALYNTLREYPIRYTPEKYQPDQAQQSVRRPDEILDRPGEGTCLDLSLLFCGICIGCDLIPWLVRVKGHAFVMVSLSHRLRDWRAISRPEWKEFLDGPLKDATKMKGWIDGGRYLAVECTGFCAVNCWARARRPRAAAPTTCSSSTTARAAGRNQFDTPSRPLEYAIDLAVARYEWKFESDGLRPARRPPTETLAAATHLTRSATQAPRMEDLKCLIDRRLQRDAVIESLKEALGSSSGRPSVFFMQGDIKQVPTMLVRRLVKFDLPEWLENLISEQSLRDIQVELPSRTAKNFDDAVRSRLKNKLLQLAADTPSWPEVTAWLHDRPDRVLFIFPFSTSQWLEDGRDRLELLLDSWQQCGDLHPARTPIVCVQIVYDRPPPTSWLSRLRKAVGNLFGHAGNDDDSLRDYLDRLVVGTKYPRVKAVRLEPLANVELRDLVEWQGLDWVQNFSQETDFTDQINTLFQGKGSGLPMVDVVKSLDNWLKPYAKGD